MKRTVAALYERRQSGNGKQPAVIDRRYSCETFMYDRYKNVR